MSAPAAIAFATSPDEVMPPSPMTGTPCARRHLGHVVDRRDLRHADAGDDARRADRVVHDRVVRDEAVRRAVDLDVVDRDRDAEVARLELLDDAELVEVPLGVRDVQPGDLYESRQRSSVVPTSPPRCPARGATFGKLPCSRKQRTPKSSTSCRDVFRKQMRPSPSTWPSLSTRPSSRPSQVERGRRTCSCRGQVLLVALAELREQPRPLQRVEVDVDDLARASMRRPDAR